MRLINAHTKRIEEHFRGIVPRYAIASHTWEDEEVTLPDMQRVEAGASFAAPSEKKGYYKIMRACEQAIDDEPDYAWMDTCCI